MLGGVDYIEPPLGFLAFWCIGTTLGAHPIRPSLHRFICILDIGFQWVICLFLLYNILIMLGNVNIFYRTIRIGILVHNL